MKSFRIYLNITPNSSAVTVYVPRVRIIIYKYRVINSIFKSLTDTPTEFPAEFGSFYGIS